MIKEEINLDNIFKTPVIWIILIAVLLLRIFDSAIKRFFAK